MINKDRAAWIKFADGLHDATMEAFKAHRSERTLKMLLNTGDASTRPAKTAINSTGIPDENWQAATSQKSGN